MFKILLMVSSLGLVACSTYQARLDPVRKLLNQRQYQAAAKELTPYAFEPSDDQMIYLLDHATSLQAAENFEESTKSFLLAGEIAGVNDYHSISKITGSMLLNEDLIQYKGESYEKLFINVMLAINFIMSNNFESALVETKKINQYLELLSKEDGHAFDQNPFAYYLTGMIWEQNGKYDDAFLDYKKAYELRPEDIIFQKSLLQSAYLSQRMQSYRKYKKKFGLDYNPEKINKKFGEVVLIYLQGWSPRKGPSPTDYRLPWLYKDLNPLSFAYLQLGDEESFYRSEVLTDIENVAIESFTEDYNKLLARRAAARIIKAVAADQVRQRNEGLGDALELAMILSEKADLRQWSTLPRTIQLVRVPVKAGEHTIKVSVTNGEDTIFEKVKVASKKKTFLFLRDF